MKVNKLYSFMLLAMMMALCNASRLNIANASQNLKVKKHLGQLNKTPLKSIKSKDGDVIDCVHISQQPAFDHPSLKDHNIQMKPNNYPESAFAMKKLFNTKSNGKHNNKPITQLWQLNGRCPEGTIPIKRTKKEDALNAVSIKSFGKKQNNNLDTTSQYNVQSVVAGVEGETYYGAKASINLWEPQVQNPNEFSSSQVWIFGGGSSDLNAIEAGWHVFPQIYGDNRTRLFIFWTRDNYESTGCYNLLCSGFIQINNEITLGGTISPLSTLHGSQFEIDILIWKEPSQDAWWLQYNNITIGYWPTSLFTNLANSAPMIEWGGLVLSSESDGQQTSTQMGSGHFPEEGFSMAGYMRNLEIVDDSFTLRPLSYPRTAAAQPNCYNIALGKADNWGDFIFYGGPGRNPNCP